jgi:hypothetical protein
VISTTTCHLLTTSRTFWFLFNKHTRGSFCRYDGTGRPKLDLSFVSILLLFYFTASFTFAISFGTRYTAFATSAFILITTGKLFLPPIFFYELRGFLVYGKGGWIDWHWLLHSCSLSPMCFYCVLRLFDLFYLLFDFGSKGAPCLPRQVSPHDIAFDTHFYSLDVMYQAGRVLLGQRERGTSNCMGIHFFFLPSFLHVSQSAVACTSTLVKVAPHWCLSHRISPHRVPVYRCGRRRTRNCMTRCYLTFATYINHNMPRWHIFHF